MALQLNAVAYLSVRSNVFGEVNAVRSARSLPIVHSRKALSVKAGNANVNGIFAPIVRQARNVIGMKPFNQLRGKGIALHSQVITEFCNEVGAEPKTRQRLIRTAKKNGEELGFLA
eukprot:CAMPEP_0196584216 /NCGR_PEP_ID=MMETSP1081-20130531/46230_1 /TAXON_ID=36882 /ORGANISM="Pyramimonas amylifera, Strain CCMP720" /LENGTH=115 /DNA_ID=CAMNT_0041905351 /DNA_START=130 /DNA_END=477 /DNA_ORIENTATION=+